MLPYICIPTWVLNLLKGKPYPFVVLTFLLANRNLKTDNTRFMSVREIGKLSGVSVREVYNSIQKLTDLNLIQELKNRKGERIFHLPFLGDNTAAKKEVIEQAESLEEQWEAHLREMGYSDEDIEKDRNLKNQLKGMNEGDQNV